MSIFDFFLILNFEKLLMILFERDYVIYRYSFLMIKLYLLLK